MKKLLSLVLVITLLAGLTVPALAADTDVTTDARLSTVTLKVKEALGLTTTRYDTFYGNLYEDVLSPTWNLSWSGEDGSLRIEADENGNIMSYYFSDNADDTYYSRDFSSSFPKGDETAARAAAAAFLAKVLDISLESVILEPDTNNSLGSTRFFYSGVILLNGLPSPFSYYISVRAKDNAIIHFSRDSLYTKYLGDVPSEKPSATTDKAGELLKTSLALRVEYVLLDDGKTAVLRYLPESGDAYYVDAQSGKLVNLTELYEAVDSRGDYGLGSASANTNGKEAGDSFGKLTDVEQTGVSKLEGVLSKEELDKQLQTISALGLDAYTLSAADYSVNQSTDEVSCRLQYSKETDGNLWRRYVTVDGKTSALQSVYSSIPWMEEQETAKPSVTSTGAQSTAERFLSAYYGDDFAKLALYGDSDVSIYDYSNSYRYHYVQKENGYCYTGNYYNISIDATDGSVSNFDFYFDNGVTFDSASGIISMEAAVDAFFRTFTVELGYLAVPEKLDPTAPEWMPLIKNGYSYLYSLKLAYHLEREDDIYGIDAKTGQPVVSSTTQDDIALTYDDVAGHWAQAQAEKLAHYNVGWLGGSLHPVQVLTQFDLLCLLVSTGGHRYDPADTDESAVDFVYNRAYSMRLLTRGERNDSQVVTRGELVKLILNAGGYGEVANLSGVFRCTFVDEQSIPTRYYGYAALAQGLGIVGGDSSAKFACNRNATRAEAAVMLYNLMSR